MSKQRTELIIVKEFGTHLFESVVVFKPNSDRVLSFRDKKDNKDHYVPLERIVSYTIQDIGE